MKMNANIPYTGVLGRRASKLTLHGLDPFRADVVCERSMLLLPGLVIKARGWIVSTFAVLPHRVLQYFRISAASAFHYRSGHNHRETETDSSKVIQPKGQVACVSERVHDQEPIVEEPPHIRKVEDDIAVVLPLGS
jgi:hypothetical protein